MPASALTRLMDWAVEGTGARVNLWDMSGLTQLHEDLAVDFDTHQIHTSPLCTYVKTTHRGWRRCIRCKAAAAHKALRQGPFTGACHVGLTEVVVPVVHERELVAVLYGGQVHTADGGTPVGAALAAKAARMGLDPARLARLSRGVPRADAAGLREIRDRLDVARRFILAHVRASRSRLSPREAMRRPELEEIGRLRGRPRRRWLATRGMEIARQEYQKPLETGRIARRLGVPLPVFCRAFKEEAGATFKTYLLRVRLEGARRLLATTPATVTYAALETGFQSPSYFSRSFARAYGISPKEFRVQRWQRIRGSRQSSIQSK